MVVFLAKRAGGICWCSYGGNERVVAENYEYLVLLSSSVGEVMIARGLEVSVSVTVKL